MVDEIYILCDSRKLEVWTMLSDNGGRLDFQMRTQILFILNFMKKYLFLAVVAVLTISSFAQSNVVLSSFSGGQPTLALSNSDLSQVFTDWCDNQGYLNPVFVEASILDDNPLSNSSIANFSISGTFTLANGESSGITMGLELDKDMNSEEYGVPDGGLLSTWSCTPKNCSMCTPVRNQGRALDRVVGCNCEEAGNAGDEVAPACNHSSSGGAGPAILGGLIGIILGFFN